MNKVNLDTIDFERFSSQLKQYERQWIAISQDNEIVSHGNTYDQALKGAYKKTHDVVLFKVPPLKYSLSPFQ